MEERGRRGLRRVCKRRAARGGCTAPTFRGEAGDPIAMHHPVLPTTTRYSRTYATSSPFPFLFAASLLSSAFVSASSSLFLFLTSVLSHRRALALSTLFFPVSLSFVRRYCVLFFPSLVRQPLFRLLRAVAVYLLSLPRAPLHIYISLSRLSVPWFSLGILRPPSSLVFFTTPRCLSDAEIPFYTHRRTIRRNGTITSFVIRSVISVRIRAESEPIG